MYGRGVRGGGTGLGFGPPATPPVVKQLLIANLAIFFLQNISPGLTQLGAAVPARFWGEGYFWGPFTYMFLHGGLAHVGMNMFALWMFGSPIAMVWGPRRFLRFYLLCGIGAGFLIVTLPYLLGDFSLRYQMAVFAPVVGASGAVFGVLLAYSLTWPDRTIMLIFPPVAFRAIWLIPLLLFMEFSFGPPNVSHEGHLGGALVGWLLLRRHTDTRLLPNMDQLKYRWRRHRMRRKLRAVRTEERRRSWNDDRTIH